MSLPNAPITSVNEDTGEAEADQDAGGQMEHHPACCAYAINARPSA